MYATITATPRNFAVVVARAAIYAGVLIVAAQVAVTALWTSPTQQHQERNVNVYVPIMAMALSPLSSSVMMLSKSNSSINSLKSSSSSSLLVELSKINSKRSSDLSSTTDAATTLGGGPTDGGGNRDGNNDKTDDSNHTNEKEGEYARLVAGRQDDPTNTPTTSRSISDVGMTVALSTTYCTVMAAKCALPSVLALLVSSSIGLTFSATSATTAKQSSVLLLSPQQQMAHLLRITTIGIVIGKLILGPIIDHIGGKRSLYIALSTLSLCLLLLSLSQSFAVFSIIWMIIDFTFSACWPACIHTIYEYFPNNTKEWSKQIGYVAAAARVGNTIAFTLFAGILYFIEHSHVFQMKQYWRPVFFVAAIMQLLPIVLLTIFGKVNYTATTDTSNHNVRTSKPPTLPDSTNIIGGGDTSLSTRSSLLSSFTTLLLLFRTIVSREMIRCDFWLHMINRSMLMIVASFLLFVPTLMTSVYRMSTTASAQIGSLYAMGCLMSVTMLSKYYAKMSKRVKLWCITILLLFGSTGSSFLQLAHVSGYVHVSPWFSSLLLFIWGFSFAIPFYIPPSLYALARGGKELSATITDFFDIGGFGLLAIFNGYVASIEHTQISAWIPTFCITTTCAFISFVSLFIATWREQ